MTARRTTAKSRRLPGAQQLGIGQTKQNQRSIESGGGARNRVGQRAVLARHVVERAVRLHVLQYEALRGGHAGERGDLIQHQIFDLRRRRPDLAAAEADQVGEARVGAHRNAAIFCQPKGLAHDAGVAGVEAAGDVCGRDAGHQRRVLAHRPRS